MISKEDFAKSKVLREHSTRGKEVARSLDLKAVALPHALTFTGVRFEEFMSELTPQRFELLRLAVRRRRSINDLAAATHRQPRAVSRDVAKLEQLCLVRIDLAPHVSHGQIKVVSPVARIVVVESDIGAV